LVLRPSIFQYIPILLAPALVFVLLIFHWDTLIILIAFWAFVLLAFLWASFHRLCSKYVIHSDRIDCSWGFLNKRTVAIHFENIQDVSTNSNFFQTPFNIGNIVLDTSGKEGEGATLVGVPDPVELADHIYKKRFPGGKA